MQYLTVSFFALKDLYYNTSGPSWLWREEGLLYGLKWNFALSSDGVNCNPCCDSCDVDRKCMVWQGVYVVIYIHQVRQ